MGRGKVCGGGGRATSGRGPQNEACVAGDLGCDEVHRGIRMGVLTAYEVP